MVTPTAPARWPLFACSEAPASQCASASCYGRTEDVGVLPVVVTKLELGNVGRKVFGGNLVIRSHDAALNQRPETFDGLSVDRAHDVFI